MAKSRESKAFDVAVISIGTNESTSGKKALKNGLLKLLISEQY